MKITETERLALYQVTTADAPFILELLNSEGWLKSIGDRNVHTLEQAQFYIENSFLKGYQKHGFGMYLVKRKADGISLGMSGLVQRDYFTGPDIGYAFLPDHTGQGYAFEAAQAILALAAHDHQVKELLFWHLPPITIR
jgi:[ribosomal protein S5]-alanine N-acetyltransferase